MQTTIEPSAIAPTTDEAAAWQAAAAYLHAKLGAAYRLEQGFLCDDSPRLAWRFLVLNQEHDAVAGYVDVDAETGEAVPLDDEQLQDMRERAIVTGAKTRKTVARGKHGYILPFLAKVRVNGYLSNHVALFASASGIPAFVDGDPPVWRVATALRLRGHNMGVDLGVVVVDALTGEVIPLTDEQIQHMQRCAEDVAATLQRSATPAG